VHVSLSSMSAPFGHVLLDKIQARLPQLSPLMRSIGAYCLRMHAWLHQMSIEEVAGQCGTVPSSVVRFTRLFGHRGYQDFKLAFLDQSLRPALTARPTAPSPSTWFLSQLEEDIYQLSALRDLLQGDAFLAALTRIRAHDRLVLTHLGERDRMAAMQLGDALQRIGKIVLLTDPVRTNAATPWAGEALQVVIDLDRPARPGPTGRSQASTDAGVGKRIDLIGTDRLQQAQLTPDNVSLPIFGNTPGRRMQKVLSIADTIEVALR
jgi:Helix-turn-helix domain, rpiR family